MSSSEFIAGLIGPALIVISLAILTNRAALTAMLGQMANNYAVVFLAGLILLISGLAIVRLHNIWAPGWPVLITIFGWLAILGGLLRMLVPDRLAAIAGRFIASPVAIPTTGIFNLLLGAFLTGKGYGLF